MSNTWICSALSWSTTPPPTPPPSTKIPSTRYLWKASLTFPASSTVLAPLRRIGAMLLASRPLRNQITLSFDPYRATSTPITRASRVSEAASLFDAASTVSAEMNSISPVLGNTPLTRMRTKSESSPYESIHDWSWSLFVRDTSRLSTCLLFQALAWRWPGKHSLNRPVFRVGFPNTHHTISVLASVSAPSVVSQIMSGIAEASSNITRMRLSLLCNPANASVFLSDQGTMSIRHVLSCAESFANNAVAVNTKNSLARNI